MFKAIVFGLAVGAGVQAWRQWPADGPATTDAALTCMFVGFVCCYFAGRWDVKGRGGAHASAAASATAVADVDVASVATSTVNVAVVIPGQGAGRDEQRMEAMPWVDGTHRQISSDELDGFDLSEFVEQHEHETA